MTIRGKTYTDAGKDGNSSRGVAKRRVAYLLSGDSPTYEQQVAIDSVEKGLQGNWGNSVPYDVIRRANALGVELLEEEMVGEGKWIPVANPDVPLTTMTAGAL